MPNDFTGRTDLPRGIRNNNPGNIKIGDAWQGMTGNDGTFVTFADIVWGTRALATDLANKIRSGKNTIRAIINTYAPPSENLTPKYIAAVSEDTGLDPDSPLSMDPVTLHNLVRAIMNHENGGSSLVTDQDIEDGISRMNNTLLSLFQAAGVAVENVAEDVAGNGSGGKSGIVLIAVLVGAYLLFSGGRK